MKKSMKTLALSAAILAMGATANAAVIDLNIYGASAEFLFWNAAAPNFLKNVRGCAVTSQTTSADGKHEITQGTGCDGGANTINLRYSAKASYDGIYAVSNKYDPTVVAPATQQCPGLPGQRKLINGAGNNGTSCQEVHLGASDVAGESFTQSSDGQVYGMRNGGAVTRSFNGVPTTGLTPYQPIVVPFGFFANNAIKVEKCVGGAADGALCTAATAVADCGTGSVCTQKTIDNITREMAVQIFSGNILSWKDFGASYSVAGDPTDSVYACFRHAGSGTHSSLDKAVFAGVATLTSLENSGGSPYAYFNDSSSDEIKCVNGNIGTGTGSAIGAIGYADADQTIGTAGSSQNVVALKYNGLAGRRSAIRNGAYDFFSNQWLYENPTKTPTTSAQHTLISQLVNFASNPANIPAAKANFWAAASEMTYNKANDSAYPAYVGATTPMVP